MNMIRHAIGSLGDGRTPSKILGSLPGTRSGGMMGGANLSWVNQGRSSGMGMPRAGAAPRVAMPTRPAAGGGMAAPSIATPTPNRGPSQPLSMPSPSIARAPRASGGGGSTAMGGMMAMAGLTGAAGIAGGTTSYAGGGNFSQGFVTGAMGGAALGMGGAGAMRRGANVMGDTASKHLKHYGYDDMSANASAFSKKMGSMSRGMATKEGRRAAFGAGAMLGGGIFGGDRSHKRGFNSSRGNSFGR